MPITYTRIAPHTPLPPNTLGIEVTDAILAAACDLGNIDPQHGFARGPLVAGRAAIDSALTWPLPPPRATLVTIRPDADSIGAMAVLALRALGEAFTPEMLTRVELIARSDCFDYGDWARWAAAHPAPLQGETLLALSPHVHEFRALAAFIGSQPDDLALSVAMMREWLVTGALPPQGLAEVEKSDRSAAAAWGEGLIRVDSACSGRVAIVRSNYPGAIALGYRNAAVVIAEGSVRCNRKITVAQFAIGHLDMTALAARLNAIELGWGGSETILGSPQGRASVIKIEQIVEIIEQIGLGTQK